MMLKKLAAVLAMAGLAAFTTGASATPTISNTDGALSPFGGFDWASNSTAWTSGFNTATAQAGDKFTLYYVAYATSLTDDGGDVLAAPHLDNITNGAKSYGAQSYEYTIFATLQEEVISCTPGSCTFHIIGGSTFDIYYDTNANAKTVANGKWTGFTDGVSIISGTIDSTANNDTFSNLTGGQANLQGTVTNTNTAYVNPALVGTNITSTLQLSTAITNFKTPTGVDAFTVGAGEIVFQADSNQTFTNQTPEPAALALVGLALGACGLASRRRTSV